MSTTIPLEKERIDAYQKAMAHVDACRFQEAYDCVNSFYRIRTIGAALKPAMTQSAMYEFVEDFLG